MALDPARLDAFVGRFVEDLGTALHLTTVIVGDRLGLYQAMADGSPVTAGQLAERTGTDEGHVSRWLAAQAAAGYVEDGPVAGTYRLPAEHAAALTGRGAPVHIPGAGQVAAATIRDEPALTEAFRTGRAARDLDHHPDLYLGVERWTRASLTAQLIDEWLPAAGIEERLRDGAMVADLDCGRGTSTTLMAQAFPGSWFLGIDGHDRSVDVARRAAGAAGVGRRVRFERASAHQLPGDGYDLITSLDGITGPTDPDAIAARVRSALAPDGVWLLAEPAAGSDVGTYLSTLLGTASAGCLREAARAAGFTRVRRAGRAVLVDLYEARV